MGAKYSSNYSSNETAYWNEKDKKWEIKGGINCITSVNFFLGYMLKKGGNGYKPDFFKDDKGNEWHPPLP
jgi:hypothetical protein